MVILKCAVCGGEAPARRQWWNRDKGHGVCLGCAAGELAALGAQGFFNGYGRAGKHWGACDQGAAVALVLAQESAERKRDGAS